MTSTNDPFMQRSRQFILLVLASLVACTRDVTIPVQPYESSLSIQSLITPGLAPTVYLYRTVSFFDPKVTPADLFVRDGLVTLSSPDGSEVLHPDSTWNAFRCHYDYHYAGARPVQAGRTYTLSVESKGQRFSATATTNQRIVPLDSVTYNKAFSDLYGEHEGVMLHFRDPAGVGENYRFAMRRTYAPTDTIYGTGTEFSACALGRTTSLEEIGRSVYADQNADGAVMTITVEPAFKHNKGQVGYVQLQVMDQAAFEYFDQLDRQKLSQFNPFVEPVFIVRRQFGGRAFGVFGAYSRSDSLRFVYPE